MMAGALYLNDGNGNVRGRREEEPVLQGSQDWLLGGHTYARS